MQKFDPAKIYGLVHYDTKAKNYYVKRFTFEMQPAGKEVSIISEEPGSKMIFITGKPDAQVQVDVEKGKSKTPETLMLELASLIDVKGLKATGNRLSQHDIKNVSLVDPESEIGIELVEPIVVDDVDPIAVENDVDEGDQSSVDEKTVREIVVDEVVPEIVEEAELPEIKIDEKSVVEVKKKPVFKVERTEAPEVEESESQKIEKAEKASDQSTEETEQPTQEEPKPAKKVDFEITNPDDIKIDDKGQLGFF
jgi:topoisomerase-4 subunit A